MYGRSIKVLHRIIDLFYNNNSNKKCPFIIGVKNDLFIEGHFFSTL